MTRDHVQWRWSKFDLGNRFIGAGETGSAYRSRVHIYVGVCDIFAETYKTKCTLKILCLLIDRSIQGPLFDTRVNLGLFGRKHLPEPNFHLCVVSKSPHFRKYQGYANLESMDKDLHKLLDTRRRLQLNVLLEQGCATVNCSNL
jgi:hypothetical protein